MPDAKRLTPCVVLDTETTGFPNNGGGFCGRLIEVGAVVITADARVVSPIQFFVRQPEDHLRSWQAKRAMQVHGIRPGQVLREGLDAAEAAARFARWLDRVRDRFGVEELRAYNQAFDFWFLERDPWDLFRRTGLRKGEDIQLTAQRAMKRKASPRLKTAVDYVNAQGADCPWLSKAHRATEDARMAAMVAVHLTREGRGSPPA